MGERSIKYSHIHVIVYVHVKFCELTTLDVSDWAYEGVQFTAHRWNIAFVFAPTPSDSNLLVK